MPADSLSRKHPLAPEPPAAEQSAGLADLIRSLLFYAILGLGAALPIALGTLGEYFR